MSAVQKADPGLRRKTMLIVVSGIVVGTLLIIVFERFQASFLNWLLSEPERLEYRLSLFCFFAAVFGSGPLFALAVYMWPFGDRVMRARRFPLPGHRVVRDTPILEAQAAIMRGRNLKIMAILLGVAGVLLCYAIWRFASALAKNAG